MSRGFWGVLAAGLLIAGAAQAAPQRARTNKPAAQRAERGSIAAGKPGRGRLIGARRLPERGAGFLQPPTWSTRGLSYGTDELVQMVVRAARRVRTEMPGSTLYVGDLSLRRGGPSDWHRSHQNGLDADLMFFAVDRRGRPAPPPKEMYVFSASGRGEMVDKQGRRLSVRFDTPRNWALVKALLADHTVVISYLFIAEPLEQLMIDHARAAGEDPRLISRAAALLRQPGDSLPHDDHLHVRIACPRADESHGCGTDPRPQRSTREARRGR